MPEFQYIVVALLTGYLYSSQNFESKSRMMRLAGNHLLYYISLPAIVIMLVSVFIFFVFHTIISFFLAPCTLTQITCFYDYFYGTLIIEINDNRFINYPPFFIISAISICIGIFYPEYKNLRLNSNKRHKIYKKTIEHDELEKMLIEAIEKKQNICLTLLNNKVYIGKPLTTMGISFEQKQYIRLLPISSGYREEKEKKLKIITYYDEIYINLINNNKGEEIRNFSIVIPYNQILSAKLFDMKYYLKFPENVENGKKT